MILKLNTFRSYLWILVIFSLFFAFPLQVWVGSPYPSLLPYLILVAIIFLSASIPQINSGYFQSNRINGTDIVVGLYVCWVFFYTIIQLLSNVISLNEAWSGLVIFILPVTFYVYFKWFGTEQDIRCVFFAIAIAGLISGLYFCYDTYLKLALGQISPYALKAFDYVITRAGVSAEEANQFSISIGRSFGLLEKHSISGAWIVLGAVAALTILPKGRFMLRGVVILMYGSMVLIGMNCTNVIAFFIILFVAYFTGRAVQHQIVTKIAGGLILTLSLILFVSIIVLCFTGNSFLDNIIEIYIDQSNLLFGIGERNNSFITIMGRNFNGFWQHIDEHPYVFLFGDGFSTKGMIKGGDIGWVESCALFGVPMFLLIVIGLVNLVCAARKQLKKINKFAGSSPEETIARRLQFGISVILLILVNDGHYTIWSKKSILPILFFALALLGRCRSSISKQRLQMGGHAPKYYGVTAG